MSHLIIAAHGHLATEFTKSAEMVFGDLQDVHSVTFVPGEGQDTLVEKYQEIMKTIDNPEDVIFLVDLFGGSPYNAAVRVAAKYEKVDVVTGVNLPMLLEVLDAKDNGDSIAELSATAQEVGGLSIKSYRNTTKPQKKTAPTPIAEKPPTTPVTGEHLQIALLRIDDRLIHGQVATSWAKAVKCDAIFAISDEVAKDELRRELLLQIAPPHLKSYVISVDKAIKVYHNPKYASRRILMLVTKPADVVRLVESGVEIDKVNVGGMTYKDGNKQLSDAVTVSKSDVEAFEKLNSLGIKLELQKLANQSKEDVMKKLAHIKF